MRIRILSMQKAWLDMEDAPYGKSVLKASIGYQERIPDYIDKMMK